MGNLCTSCPSSRVNKESDHAVSARTKSILSNGRASAFSKSEVPRKVVKKKGINHEIAAPSVKEAVNALVTSKIKNLSDRRLILTVLQSHLMFSGLDDESKELAMQEMKHYQLAANEFVYRQGCRAANFFILASGAAEVLVHDRRARVIEPGQGFGDIALLHDTMRNASVRTLKDSELWGIERSAYRHFVETLNAQTFEENASFINTIPLFASLTQSQKGSLIQCLSVSHHFQGQAIVKEGDLGDWLYIIKEGEVVCSKDAKELRRMKKGEFFGEQSLLYGGVRTATVTALSKVKCLYISGKDFKLALGDCMQNIIYTNTLRVTLSQHSLFSHLAPPQLDKLIKGMRVECFDSGSVVLYADTNLSSGLWVVLKGTLRVDGTSKIFAETFGCFGINSEEVIVNDVVVATDIADVGWLTREEVEMCLGGPIDQAAANTEALAALKQVQLLKSLPTEKFLSLLKALRLRHYSDSQTIVTQNTPGDAFYIIKSGCVDILRDTSLVRTITKLDYFGERSVLFNESRTATVKAKGEVVCWVLERPDFMQIIGQSLRLELIRRIETQDETVTLDDLIPIKTLGKGMFGIVLLVSHRDKRTLYALKSVSRAKIQLYDLHKNILLERKVLMQIDHNLIIKLVKTFKDEKRVYFLLEYIQGTDFFDVLRILGILSNADSRFYTGSVVTILDHLHARDIVYRDLKPENIMVDEEGYLKLIDFGTAKIVSGRTYSMVGTPHYMAPEVIMGKGYGTAVDYWSLGIILYEMICGGVPFAEDEEDPYLIYEQILSRVLVFPGFLEVTMPAKVMIDQLLSMNPGARTNGGVDKLKKHKWFKAFDWEKLESRDMIPPYVPNAEGKKREIAVALANRKTVNQALLVEEDDEIKSSNRRENREHRSRPAPPPNWDEEF